MVAATIERCPRSMMLRELVMNALEAAAGAAEGERRVVVDAVAVEGVAKLRIFNTGRGLSPVELLTITDLSSSLFKTVGLDGNFGMGAKAASLTSNRHGLVYRSCRHGSVAEVTLGERGGVYGRLRRPSPDGSLVDVLDVTETYPEERLGYDWTEVVLLGNAPEQDTTTDPYAGDPAVPADWVAETLGKRFLALPEGVELRIEAGTREPGVFVPPLGPRAFDRVETVTVGEGVRIHYGYRAETSGKPRPLVKTVGLGAVLSDGEVYALVEGRRWLLEAPTYGFTFAARQVSVLVELPRSARVRPEQYRQFLRFTEGDQRQVQFADFGELVRENVPLWLRRIIDAMKPAAEDYLAEIAGDLAALLAELGIERRAPERAAKAETTESVESGAKAESAAAPAAQRADAPPSPVARNRDAPRRPFAVPPEIIVIDGEEQLAEKALGGRAARYYPDRRQLFVNARYEAFVRLRTRLAEDFANEFAVAADRDTLASLARHAAEWALVSRLARSLVHSLGKPSAGWSEDEIRMVQSPEALSLVVDDIEAVLPAARKRLAQHLGVGEAVEARAVPWRTLEAQREAGLLAEAEAQLQRAMAASVVHLGPHYQRIANLLARQGRPAEARAWIDKGLASDPDDPWCRFELAGLLLAEGDFDGAAAAADAALALSGPEAPGFWRRRAEIALRRGDEPGARAILDAAIAANPADAFLHFDRAGLDLEAGDLDGAARSLGAATALGPVPPPVPFLRRRAEILRRRGEGEAARRVLSEALGFDPAHTGARLDLVRILSDEGAFDAAAALLDTGVEEGHPSRALLLRARSELERRRGRPAAALAACAGACEADPTDPGLRQLKAGILLDAGDLDGAEAAIAEGLALSPAPAAGLLRLRGMVARRRGDPAASRAHFEAAIAADPADPWSWLELSALALAEGDLPAADAAAETGMAAAKAKPGPFLCRRAEIALRAHDGEAARRFVDAAVAADPDDAATHLKASTIRLACGDLDGAFASAETAIGLSREPSIWMLRRCFEIEMRRGNAAAARDWLERAIAMNPGDPQPWVDLSRLLSVAGDLPGAQSAAEKALELNLPSLAVAAE